MKTESQKLNAQVTKIEQATKNSTEIPELRRLLDKSSAENKRMQDRMNDLEKELKEQIDHVASQKTPMMIASQPGSAAPQMKSFSGSSNWKGQSSQVMQMQKSVKPSSSEDVIQPLHSGKPTTTEV